MQSFIATYKNPITKQAGHQRIIDAENKKLAKNKALQAGTRINLSLLNIKLWNGKW